jgi:UTP--glucose-1-phosphate uridylyltransferase
MKTVVITTAGLGTRLLTATKASPKTLLPLYDKPIEIIFEALYDNGFRKFIFIVGTKNKKSILNHMIPDRKYIELLKKRNNQFDKRFACALQKFYKKFEKCEIKWISQDSPMGFGHALLTSKKFVGKNPFLLHAGDAYFPDYSFLNDFIKYSQHDKKIIASLLFQRKKHLEGFGIVQTKKNTPLDIVFDVVEKPKKPKSNLAILPIYILKPDIFNALEKTNRGYNNELQITDAISTLLKWNQKVTAYNFRNNKWFDIGTGRQYFYALNYSFKKST